ncbi:glycosyltransferase family 4 protein [Azohydromonas australica]|uniref:glycosyltransferase family 4 protein n=1 Tax=Azohydromonas australica TaxID=364039 RepID=UPI00040EFB6C|nr:glycosyltransferase family 1 protein [Azohydromonas australica]
MKRRIAFVQQFSDKDWLGGKNYFSSLMNAIHAVAPDSIQMVLFTGHKITAELPRELPFLDVVRTPLLDRRHPAWIGRQLMRSWYRLQHDPVFDRLLQRERIDLLSHTEPLVAARTSIKTLGWLPDFQFMHLPQFWSEKQISATQRSYNTIVEHSDAVVVSSHHALHDLRHFAPASRTPAHVLHFIPSRVRFDGILSREQINLKYDLPERYIHLPNQFWAHKNHGVVLEALSQLKAAGSSATVVCTGHTRDVRRPEYFDQLMARCRDLGLENNFRVLGVVPYVDMQSLMLHAHAVLNPSKFEGWSTTVEEAKLMGKTIILSDIAVHREQAPERGFYFALGDPQALATVLDAVQKQLPHPWSRDAIESRYGTALMAFGKRYLSIINTL